MKEKKGEKGKKRNEDRSDVDWLIFCPITLEQCTFVQFSLLLQSKLKWFSFSCLFHPCKPFSFQRIAKTIWFLQKEKQNHPNAKETPNKQNITLPSKPSLLTENHHSTSQIIHPSNEVGWPCNANDVSVLLWKKERRDLTESDARPNNLISRLLLCTTHLSVSLLFSLPCFHCLCLFLVFVSLESILFDGTLSSCKETCLSGVVK